jgi:hypothetical protein
MPRQRVDGLDLGIKGFLLAMYPAALCEVLPLDAVLEAGVHLLLPLVEPDLVEPDMELLS